MEEGARFQILLKEERRKDKRLIAAPAYIVKSSSDLSRYDCSSQLLRRVLKNVSVAPPLVILRCGLSCSSYVGVPTNVSNEKGDEDRFQSFNESVLIPYQCDILPLVHCYTTCKYVSLWMPVKNNKN